MNKEQEGQEVRSTLPTHNYRGITRDTHARLKIVQANLTLRNVNFKFHEVIDLCINEGIDRLMSYLTCEHNMHRESVTRCGQCGLAHAETLEPPWVIYRRVKEKGRGGVHEN